MKKTLLAFATITLLGASALNASSLSYEFMINTQSLNGQADNLDFQLNPGQVPGSSAVSILISGFVVNGGSFSPAAIQLTGDASGALPGSLTLNNTTMYNDAYQSVMLGSSITFLATLSGPGVNNPASPGTFFGVSIYDNAGVTPLLTTSIDGTIAGFNIDGNAGVASFTNPATVNGVSAASVTPTPEPSTVFGALLGLSLMMLVAPRCVSRQFQRQ